MGFVDRTLVCAEQSAFDQGSHTMHPRQQLVDVRAPSPSSSLAARLVGIAKLVDALVTGPTVGDHGSLGFDVVGDESVQRRPGGVLQRCHPAPTQSAAGGDLHSDPGLDFLALGAVAGQSGFLTTNVGLIDPDNSGQPLASWPHQHRSQPMQHRPRCGV